MLIAAYHLVQMLAIAVAHGNKIRQQAAVGFLHREITLVLLHHRNQHFGGQVEVSFIKVAAQGSGGFNQVGHLVQQAVIQARAGARIRQDGAHLAGNRRPAGSRVQDDTLAFEE